MQVTELDRDAVLDLAIEVATELPAVKDYSAFFERADGTETFDVRRAERVCASGAVRVAIHRLTGLTGWDDLVDAERAVFGHPIYFRMTSVTAVETGRIPAYLREIQTASA